MRWRVYYDQLDKTFSSLEGEPWEAPKDGVIAVLYFDGRDGWQMRFAHDWYYFVAGDKTPWWCSDTRGLLYQVKFRTRDILAVLEGALASHEVYEEQIRRVVQDRRQLEGK